MDGVIKFLPSPTEKAAVKATNLSSGKIVLRPPEKKEKLVALCFKVVNDLSKGPLAYVRIYSGVLQNRLSFYNSTRNIIEKPTQMFRARANEYVSVNELHAGDIAVLSGLKLTSSGDTLIDSKDEEKIVLEGVTMPPPVFIASLEYQSLKDKPLLEEACRNLTREDPSLKVKEDEETGQLLVYGLGELHLDIFRDRLQTEYNLKTKLGKMKVAYRESISGVNSRSEKVSRMINGKPNYSHIDLKIEHIDPSHLNYGNEDPESSSKVIVGSNMIEYHFEKDSDFMRYYNEFKRREEKKKIRRKRLKQNHKGRNRTVPRLSLKKLKN